MKLFSKLFKKNAQETFDCSELQDQPISSSNIPSEEIKRDSDKDKPQRHKVAGTSFHQKEIRSLGYENDDYKLTKTQLINSGYTDDRIYQICFNPVNVVLEEEPTNEYDPNAIKVIIDNVHVGYIKKGSCSRIKKLIKEDKISKISAKIKGGAYKALYCDDEYADKLTYTLDKGTTDYTVSIYLTIR